MNAKKEEMEEEALGGYNKRRIKMKMARRIRKVVGNAITRA